MTTTTAIRHHRHRSAREVTVNIPWGSIGGGLFWGAGTILCGIVAVDFFIMGGVVGILCGIIYAGFMGLNGYLMVGSIVNNSVFGY